MVKFRKMYPDAMVYGNEGTDGEFIQILTRDEQLKLMPELENGLYYAVPFENNLPIWKEFNARVREKLIQYVKPKDLILVLGGRAQNNLFDIPDTMTVEYGVGYEGVYGNYRVFESYAWLHYVYGLLKIKDGLFYDTVINNYFDLNDFTYSDKKENYFLFLSRMTRRKGYEIAIEIAERTKTKLIIAGNGGDRPESPYVEYVGYADTAKRAELLKNAKALLCPTIYLEPFGGVTIEAMLSGTPVITTDFGAFTETVVNGFNGFRCNTLGDFIQAADNIKGLNNADIREYAAGRFSIEAIKPQYDKYFSRLNDLWGKGWYTI
jgi:glycosyltransferase involved in cell wall biosynthesis